MPEPGARSDSADAARDDATVLVVEDERALAALYEEWLADEYEVRTAHAGRDALDRLDDAVDVVLLDRRLPGLSGREVLGEIRDRGDSCQVAMVTAVEPGVDVLEMGFDDYLTKPATRADVRRLVSALVDRKQYDVCVQRYFRLLSKRAALEREHGDLADRPEYHDLRADIAAIEAELGGLVEEFSVADFDAQFRSLPSASSAADD